MKKTIFALAAGMLLAGALMTGCTTSAEKVDNAQDKVSQANKELDQANKEYLADVESYKKETAERIAANDKALSDLKASIAQDKHAVKADYNRRIAVLEQKNAEMKMKMAGYQANGKAQWQSFKAEFSHDMDELGKAFKDLTVKNVK
ncbi:MAG: hypothetical protein WCO44_07575 [Bacteroidota bacterium]